MTAPKHISNPTDAQLASYAAANGYKELRTTEAPSAYHTLKYREYDEYITYAWYSPELDTLKATKKIEAENKRDYTLDTRVTLPIEGIGNVEWSERAESNIDSLAGLMLKGLVTEESYILADDSVVTLTSDQVDAIAMAFRAHKASIYALKTYAFTLIDASTDVDTLIALDIGSLELPTSEEVSE